MIKIKLQNEEIKNFRCDPENLGNLREEVESVNGLSKIFKVLSDESRLKIIYALSKEKELSVHCLATIINSTTQKTSYHLRLLAELNLCNCRKEGKIVYYELKDNRFYETVNHLISRYNTKCKR